jgi:ABC-type Na+ efflux pump permease subunit
MSKTVLVARREFLENVRTKTFWIGIFAFPVIFGLSIAVPIWLRKAKDVRQYAVVDHSGWLNDAVKQRTTLPDLEKVILEALKRAKADPESLEQMPPPLRANTERLLERTDAEVRQFASVVATALQPEGSEMPLPDWMREALAELRESLRAWYQALPPEEAAKYAPDLDKNRYQLVEVADPGADAGTDPETMLKQQLDRGEIFAYFVIGPDPVAGSAGCKYVSNNLTDKALKKWYESFASAEVRARRFTKEQIDQRVAERIQRPLEFEEKKVGEGGVEEKVEAKDKARQWAPVVFVYLLWLTVFMMAQMLLTNTVEEKSNRIIEVLLSSVSPLQLMVGKILGIALTGLTMIGSWIVFFLVAVKAAPLLFDSALPFDLSVIVRDPVYLTSFIVYFMLGYLLYASLLVGIGSVCNSLKEAQNLIQPVVILLIVPLLAMIPIGEDPNGTLAKFLSYIPLFTPFVMMNRAAGPPSTAEYLATGALLLLAVIVAMWAAAKIFRIGVLMTGKPPKIGEILRWIRAPVGAVPVRREPGATDA